eukprot:5538391-Pyramimonas_sp.AAC.1
MRSLRAATSLAHIANDARHYSDLQAFSQSRRTGAEAIRRIRRSTYFERVISRGPQTLHVLLHIRETEHGWDRSGM